MSAQLMSSKLGVLDQSFFNWIYMAALVGGGRMNNIDPASAKLAAMKQVMKPRAYPTHQQLAARFKNEEVWISADHSARIASGPRTACRWRRSTRGKARSPSSSARRWRGRRCRSSCCS
jgi:hypothetical protein